MLKLLYHKGWIAKLLNDPFFQKEESFLSTGLL